jgi:hypothetical protein
MLMDRREGELRGGLERWQAIQPVLEDRIYVAIRAGADGHGASTGGLEAGGAVAAAGRSRPRQER